MPFRPHKTIVNGEASYCKKRTLIGERDMAGRTTGPAREICRGVKTREGFEVVIEVRQSEEW